jgi:hypothetical protein
MCEFVGLLFVPAGSKSEFPKMVCFCPFCFCRERQRLVTFCGEQSATNLQIFISMETRSVVVQKNAAVTSKLTLSHAKLLSSKVGFASGLLPLDYPPIFEMLFGRGCINFWLFVVLHVIAGIGLFYFSFTWKMALLVVASYYFQMFGVTGGYHRYFSHRSFKTGRAFQFVLAWLAQTSIQKGM